MANNACKQKGCDVATTGKCLESLNLNDCPHFYLKEDNADQTELTSSIKNDKKDLVKLFDGQPYDIANLNIATHHLSSNLIFILGDYDAGKTTILTSLFDTFQKGPIENDLFFAGSMTQMGFEERCHLSRVDSSTIKADTERSKRYEFKFLHLAIKKNGIEHDIEKNFLVSDISGEKVDISRNSSSNMKDLSILKHANRILFVMDGQILSDRATRSSAIYDAIMFLQMAIDNDVFDKNTMLTVVISKWDCLIRLDDFNLNKLIIEPFQNRFENKVRNIDFMKIAARPDKSISELPMGFGLYDLVNGWFKEDETKNLSDSTEKNEHKRMINRFSFITE